MDTTKKNCGNCKYYVKYYYKKSVSFSSLSMGHCVGKKFLHKEILRDFDSCEFWESNQPIIEQRHKNITDALSDMCKKLDQIARILKDE